MSLRVQSPQGVSELPLLINFDPQYLQVVGVIEGDFMSQGGAPTEFKPQIDAPAGRVFVTTVRQGDQPAKGVARQFR